MILTAHSMLLSPAGYRDATQIRRIVYDKAKVKGSMASIVEWQSLRMQEYRYSFVQRIAFKTARFYELFGIRRPLRYEPAPAPAGAYDKAMHIDHPDTRLPVAQPLTEPPLEELQVGGQPRETSLESR